VESAAIVVNVEARDLDQDGVAGTKLLDRIGETFERVGGATVALVVRELLRLTTAPGSLISDE
jgi:hypothetical protein